MAELLILSAGRRVTLLRLFQTAALDYGIRVVAADMNPEMSAACQIADKSVWLPRADSPEFATHLLSYCAENDVRIIIPTIDTELQILSDLREQLLAIGCQAIVSDPDLISICRDKRKTAKHFSLMGISFPAIYDRNHIDYPVFVKPFDGSLSKGIFHIQSPAEMSAQILNDPRNMFCEYLDSKQFAEYTCDCYFDRNSRIVAAVPRLRIEVRGGEVSKGRTCSNEIVPYLESHLSLIEGARGCLTIQVFFDQKNSMIKMIEVNPRFGGGYPLTAQAGAEFHKWILDEYVGKKAMSPFRQWQDNLTMLRYDSEVFN